MHGPPVVSWLLVVVCAAAGGYCLTAGRGGPAPERATARAEAVMGLGMSAMALPGGAAVVPDALFVVLFGALAAWSGRSAWSARTAPGPGRGGPHGRHVTHDVHHTLEALAMVYMALVMLAGQGGAVHSGHHGGAGGVPAVTGVLLVYFAAFALYTGARLLPADEPGRGAGACVHLPRAPADACRLTLALGSLTMLLTL